ncbi:MAG: phenylalanine--tRNA ligase subunit beta [Desulfuromonadales bacterium]|nr:phenylalanine--tRNA ligase subunit beta [Desulfuromonadales bacterium]
MKVTRNWLAEYVDFDLSNEELAHRLTMAGLEVDAIQELGGGLESVVVARLVEVRPHPDADRLTICQVDSGSECQQVVCGATNHKTGDLVALARPGTLLPGDFKIKKSKIRGQESHGMLCSLSELGLAEEAEGIMILPDHLPLGQPVFAALGLKDTLFELGLTPNRPDCLSVVGVAREVAAMAGAPLRLPEPGIVQGAALAADKTSVTIVDADLCPRYAARLIEEVTIGPSPDWLVRRVEAVGMRSINNVVDITNFVMMELGHPLHAFDFDLLRGRRIVVRRAADGDRFTTLDGQQRELLATDLMICDGEGPVALAGIMGGENSEVRPETVNILLESAYFDPAAIRRTSKRLGLHTESAHRFERGADVDMVPLALDRAAALIAELAGGTMAQGVVDAYPAPLARREIALSVARTGEILGFSLSADEVRQTLESIDLACRAVAADRFVVTIPNFRPDLEREIDLIEEVARLVGYDRIPVTMPRSVLTCQRQPDHLSLAAHLRDRMVALGFAELVNYSFISPTLYDKLGLAADDPRRQNVCLLNPLSEEQSVMRGSLLPSLLETACRNLAYRSENLALFELRPVFAPVEGAELPAEKLRLVALLCGRREPEGWAQQNAQVDFFDIKGCVEALLAELHMTDVTWEATANEPFYHPGKSAAVRCGGALLGTLGELHPATARAFDIQQPLYLCDLDVEAMLAARSGQPAFQAISRFPDVLRDSAFLVDESVSAAEVFAVLDRVRLKDLESCILFDLYRGEGVPSGKKSLAIRARYRALDRTLTDELVQRLHGKLIKALQKDLDIEIR